MRLHPALLPPPKSRVVPDRILDSPLTRNPGFERRVAHWVRVWKDAPWFPAYLERMHWFQKDVDSVLASHGLPRSLSYLPIVESGYSPRAVSPVEATGLWQLMKPTARGLGLRVSPLLDERRNPFKSTEAAVEFLGRLHDEFGSWLLTLAAYNAGPAMVESILNRRAPLQPRTDGLYWRLRYDFPKETREFVPKFFAAVRVAEHPARYGIDPPDSTAGFAFDRVSVPDATTLDVVARAAGVPQSEIERLNPEVLRGITPPGRKTYLRVPAGRGRIFTENYAKIPRDERVTFVHHRVRRGENLTRIAREYRIPLRDLEAANPRVRPRLLQIGQWLIVPVAPSARASVWARRRGARRRTISRAAPRTGAGVRARRRESPERERRRDEHVRFVHHRVRRGESLTRIAREYHVSLRDLEAANPHVRPRLLQIGQWVVVPVASGAPPRRREPRGR